MLKVFTDETCFTRARTFNPHNFDDWQQDKRHVVHRFNYRHWFNVNVLLAGIGGNYLIWPYLMPERFMPEMFEDVPLGIRHKILFSHDGAPAHFHRNNRQYTNNAFPNRWIGSRLHKVINLRNFRGSEIDLTIRIVVAAEKIAENPLLFERVRQSILKRYQSCIDVGSGIFEQLL